jgi:predicted transcriptional regulator
MPMPRKPTGRPTDAELSILDVLWEQGPCTVRQVQEQLVGEVGYTTVLKLMQIMTEKGLVQRDESQRAHIYIATQSQEETQGSLISDLIARAFGGSAGKLVMQALSTRDVTAAELDAIRELLDKHEEQNP